jgi:hypothetical protein
MCLFVYVSLVFVIYLMEAAKEAALQSEVPIFHLIPVLPLLLLSQNSALKRKSNYQNWALPGPPRENGFYLKAGKCSQSPS